MRPLYDTVRFFRVVPPVPRLMIASLGVVTAAACAALVWRPAATPPVIVPVLVLQVFAASTGFSASARRGYYDVLLTGGFGRVRVAVVHWLMSIAPGAAAWIALAAADALTPWASSGVRTSGTLAALFVTSTVAWAITVPLPRFAGAIGWTVVSVMAVTLLPGADGTVPPPAAIGHLPAWHAAAVFFLWPFTMAGRHVADCALAMGLTVGLSSALLLIALGWIARSDFPLEAGQ